MSFRGPRPKVLAYFPQGQAYVSKPVQSLRAFRLGSLAVCFALVCVFLAPRAWCPWLS